MRELLAVVWGFDGRCLYCGDDLDLSKAVVDHIEDLPYGPGLHHWRNLIVCCRRCNGRKGNRDVNAFLSRLYPFDERRPPADAVSSDP